MDSGADALEESVVASPAGRLASAAEDPPSSPSPDTYKAAYQGMHRALEEYAEPRRLLPGQAAPRLTGKIKTQLSKRLLDFAQQPHRQGGLGVLFLPAGSGKSTALLQFQRHSAKKVIYLRGAELAATQEHVSEREKKKIVPKYPGGFFGLLRGVNNLSGASDNHKDLFKRLKQQTLIIDQPPRAWIDKNYSDIGNLARCAYDHGEGLGEGSRYQATGTLGLIISTADWEVFIRLMEINALDKAYPLLKEPLHYSKDDLRNLAVLFLEDQERKLELDERRPSKKSIPDAPTFSETKCQRLASFEKYLDDVDVLPTARQVKDHFMGVEELGVVETAGLQVGGRRLYLNYRGDYGLSGGGRYWFRPGEKLTWTNLLRVLLGGGESLRSVGFPAQRRFFRDGEGRWQEDPVPPQVTQVTQVTEVTQVTQGSALLIEDEVAEEEEMPPPVSFEDVD